MSLDVLLKRKLLTCHRHAFRHLFSRGLWLGLWQAPRTKEVPEWIYISFFRQRWQDKVQCFYKTVVTIRETGRVTRRLTEKGRDPLDCSPPYASSELRSYIAVVCSPRMKSAYCYKFSFVISVCFFLIRE